MPRDLCAYIQDVLDAADSISFFTCGLTYETFEALDLTMSGVKHKLEVVGESLKQAAKYFPNSLDSVPDAKYAISMRDRIAHGYFSVDPKVLWNTIHEDLPKLISQMERLKAVTCL